MNATLPSLLFTIALSIIPGALLAQSRPPAPSADEIAKPGRSGWIMDQGTGCWLWDADPQSMESVSWSGACGPDGRAEGTGVANWQSAQSIRFEGEMHQGKINGHGRIAFSNGNTYKGEFKDDDFNGQGTYVFANGNRYEGEWRAGSSSGQGVFAWTNGDRYRGAWAADLPEGFGEYWISGQYLSGIWHNGCLKKGSVVAAIGRSFADCQ